MHARTMYKRNWSNEHLFDYVWDEEYFQCSYLIPISKKQHEALIPVFDEIITHIEMTRNPPRMLIWEPMNYI